MKLISGELKDKILKIAAESLEAKRNEYSANCISVAMILGDDSFSMSAIKQNYNRPDFSKNSNFLIYSLTKTIISLIILKLAESGQIKLDEKLSKWFDKYGIEILNKANVYDCLCHRAGLPDYGGLAGYHSAVKNGLQPWSFDEFIKNTFSKETGKLQIGKFSYSNIGYMLLKRIIEIETKMTFSEATNAFIFSPLSLSATKIVETKEEFKDIFFGPSVYLGSKDSPHDVTSSYHPQWVSHGVASSVAPETALIFDHISTGQIISKKYLETMLKPYFVEGVTGRPFLNPAYGAGLMIDTGHHGGLIFGHTGGGPGSSAACYHIDQKHCPVTVCVFTDGEDAAQAERIIYEIFSDKNLSDV